MPNRKIDVLVLVVEDEADHVFRIDAVLKKGVADQDGDYVIRPWFDYQITHAARFDEAKKKLQEHEYDIIILDIHLPNGAGTDLVRETRKLAPRDRTAIIVTTGYTDPHEEVEARRALANDYLDKLSTSDRELLVAIRKAAIWAVGCREACEKMQGMERVGKKMDETIKTSETVAATSIVEE
jgi:CheY-like chemotaxis protein